MVHWRREAQRMCGIAGLFLKDPKLEPELGRLTAAMLAELSDRGPDSAGFAAYGNEPAGITKTCRREALMRHGERFQTDNDSEVAAAYLTWRTREGDNLKQALNRSLYDLDGFYTFVVGTRDGFAVLRDPVACKPAVMAETDDWVAMASEYRAIAPLPGAEHAKLWEPAPATVYAWSRAA